MKAIVFHPRPVAGETAPDFLPGLACLQLSEVAVPDLPDRSWVVIRSRIAGICGSDLGFLQGKQMPAAAPYFQLPMIPGHELFGEVEAVGRKVKRLHPGQRVSIDPSLGCRERGLGKLCVQCRAGNPGICEHLADGHLKPGILIGGCGDTGGGWGEYFVAPAHRVHPLPDKIGDEEASLMEPFAVCLRAVLNNPPKKKELVVVIGAGTIGLMTVAALKAVEPGCKVAVIAKYPFQAKLARGLGADFVVDAQKEDVMERIGELTHSRVHRLAGDAALLAGGAPIVYDTITSTVSLNQALRMTRGSGSVVILGLAAMPEGVDWTPIWMKELKVIGSLTYGTEAFKGRRADTFARAIEFVARGRADLTSIKPRTYPLEQYREALIRASSKKTSGAVKVSFAL